MKKILILFLTTILLISCSKNFTPHQAANRGGLKCGKHRLK
jgi:hypothetical protein